MPFADLAALPDGPLLALDPGSKTIGVAVSTQSGVVTPVETIAQLLVGASGSDKRQVRADCEECVEVRISRRDPGEANRLEFGIVTLAGKVDLGSEPLVVGQTRYRPHPADAALARPHASPTRFPIASQCGDHAEPRDDDWLVARGGFRDR